MTNEQIAARVTEIVNAIIKHDVPKSADRTGGEIRVVPAIFQYRDVYWLKGNKTSKEQNTR